MCTSCKWENAIIWALRMCCKRAGGEPAGPGTQNPGTELRIFKQAKASEPQQTMEHFLHSGRNSSSLKSLQKCALLYSIKWALPSVGRSPQLCHREPHYRPRSGASSCGGRVSDCPGFPHPRALLECREGLSKEQGGGGAAPTEQCKASSRHWIPTNMASGSHNQQLQLGHLLRLPAKRFIKRTVKNVPWL